MRFATLDVDGEGVGSVWVQGRGWAPVSAGDPSLRGDLTPLIARQFSAAELAGVRSAAAAAGAPVPSDHARFLAPFVPGKIWGIGLNYRDHAGDLDESPPSEPASFIKGAHTVIGPGQPIALPADVGAVTSEAELGLVIGRACEGVGEEEALEHVFGVCPILDQTAEDILRRNPRYLTWVKNYRTFFAFGPTIVTLDEFNGGAPLSEATVATWKNGRAERSNSVANMTHSPQRILSFYSQVMPWSPGDIISTGTPGAVHIGAGDEVEARVSGLEVLSCTVENARPDGGRAGVIG